MSDTPPLLPVFMSDILPALADEGSRYLTMMAAAFDREVNMPIEDLVLAAYKLPDGTWAYWFTTIDTIFDEEGSHEPHRPPNPKRNGPDKGDRRGKKSNKD